MSDTVDVCMIVKKFRLELRSVGLRVGLLK